MGALGLSSILRHPGILAAVNPVYAVLGHFGSSPIRKSWFFLVYPALILNYLGQGAFLLDNPGLGENLFYRIAPSWAVLPLVVLATVATVIASQAVISGAFFIARQMVQLGLWPRIQVRHTSDATIGQVYVPFINWFLLIGTLFFVIDSAFFTWTRRSARTSSAARRSSWDARAGA